MTPAVVIRFTRPEVELRIAACDFVTMDKRSGITNDPNRADEPDYIVKLVGRVITVSVETVKIVRGLPALQLAT